MFKHVRNVMMLASCSSTCMAHAQATDADFMGHCRAKLIRRDTFCAQLPSLAHVVQQDTRRQSRSRQKARRQQYIVCIRWSIASSRVKIGDLLSLRGRNGEGREGPYRTPLSRQVVCVICAAPIEVAHACPEVVCVVILTGGHVQRVSSSLPKQLHL